MKYSRPQAKLECVKVESNEQQKEVQEIRAKLFRHKTIREERERERFESNVDEFEAHILRQCSRDFVTPLDFPEIMPNIRMRICDDDSTCDLVKESHLLRKTARQSWAKIEASSRVCSAKRKHRRSERPKSPKWSPNALESLATFIHRSFRLNTFIVMERSLKERIAAEVGHCEAITPLSNPSIQVLISS
jgi:hypothetical protein